VVPRVEREEFLNVGVIVFCRTRQYLAARIALDPRRIRALAPDIDLDAVREHLDARVRIAAGDADAGPIAALSQSERFHWLVAPASTIIQTSSVHSGLCDEPEAVLDRLFGQLVTVDA
jgi:pimeloyl-ACP methyl ester carboxylesterase